MLQKLNERFQGVFAWIIVILIAVTFTLLGVEYYIQSKNAPSNHIAEVNGKAIAREGYAQKYDRLRAAHEAHGEDGAFNEKQARQHLLDELILNELTLDSAHSYGFRVSPNQVNQAIIQIPVFQEKGQFSQARYEQTLSRAHFTHDTFQRDVQEGMLQNQLRFAFIGTDFALPNEVDEFIKTYRQTRDYRYVVISHRPFLDTVNVTPDEAEYYFKAHAKEFVEPEQISLAYVRLSAAQMKKNNPALNADSMPVEYARALETLTDLSYQTPDELDTVAKRLDLSIEKTALFSKTGGQRTALTNNPRVIQAAFSHDVLVLGNNSAPIQLDEQTVVVFRVQHHVPAKEKAFAVVHAQIDDMIRQEKAQQQAVVLGETLVNVKDAAQRQKLLAQHQLAWTSVKQAGRETQSAYEIAHALAFSMSRDASVKGQVGDAGYTVVELQKVTEGQLSAIDQDTLAGMREQIETHDGMLDYDLYIHGLLTHAKIVRY